MNFETILEAFKAWALDTPEPRSENWAQDVAANGLENPSEIILSEIIRGTYSFIRHEKWEELDSIYANLDPSKLHTTVIVALLRNVSAYKEDKLPHWDVFLQRSVVVCEDRGYNTKSMFVGLIKK